MRIEKNYGSAGISCFIFAKQRCVFWAGPRAASKRQCSARFCLQKTCISRRNSGGGPAKVSNSKCITVYMNPLLKSQDINSYPIHRAIAMRTRTNSWSSSKCVCLDSAYVLSFLSLSAGNTNEVTTLVDFQSTSERFTSITKFSRWMRPTYRSGSELEPHSSWCPSLRKFANGCIHGDHHLRLVKCNDKHTHCEAVQTVADAAKMAFC